MRIDQLDLTNFRLFDDVSLDVGRRLTLMVGENGSGKTSVLDALALGLGSVSTYLPGVSGRSFRKSGEIRQVANRLEPYCRIALRARNGLLWDRTQRRDNSALTRRLVPDAHGVRLLEQMLDSEVLDPLNRGESYALPFYAYYGVSRALLDPPLRRRGFPSKHSRFEALDRSLDATSRFKSAFIWFYNKEHEEHRLQRQQRDFDVRLKELDVVRSAINRMFVDIEEPHIELSPLRFMVTKQGELFDIMQLSDGYRTLLGMVVDLSARMAMANPHLDDPLAAEAVVLIDEVDLHLHPAWQQRVLGDLLRTFSNTQFIVTTHSPFIVEALNNYLKRYQIRELDIDNEEIRTMYALNADDTKAYLLSEASVSSMLDPESGLLYDSLLDFFNTLNIRYELMRDMQWESGAGD